MSVLSAEETRLQYQRQMGNHLGSIFYALICEVATLYEKWADYVSLFGTNEQRVVLLNRAAPGFFGRIQNTMWDDLLLHIARITDAPVTGRGRRSNLTLKQIPQFVSDAEFKAYLSARISALDQQVSVCRDWRNRRLAHTDLALSVDSGARPLEATSRYAIDLLLKALVEIMNVVLGHFADTAVAIDGAGPQDDSYEFLRIIDEGLYERDRRRARLAAGNPSPSDFRRKDF